MNPFQKLVIIIGLALLPLLSASIVSNASADVTLNAVGDIGCKTNSIKNLQNLDKSTHTLLGLGDYLYSCSSSSVQKYYDGIVKVGAKGNHEDDGQGKIWAKNNFRYGDRGYGSWKLGDIGIIILDPYQSYKQGSTQYNYVKAKSEQFTFKTDPTTGQKVPRTDINWVLYAVHEPLWTPNVGGGHGPNTGLRSTYAPIITQYKGFLLEAHNHITAFGVINSVPQVLCGGGGYGGDSLGSLNGFSWGTSSQFGFCKLFFQKDKVIVQLIGTDNTVKHTHTFTK